MSDEISKNLIIICPDDTKFGTEVKNYVEENFTIAAKLVMMASSGFYSIDLLQDSDLVKPVMGVRGEEQVIEPISPMKKSVELVAMWMLYSSVRKVKFYTLDGFENMLRDLAFNEEYIKSLNFEVKYRFVAD